MPSIEETVRLSLPPDEAWRRFGGFGDVGDWHPMLRSVESEGDHAGARRTARARNGGTQVERLTDYDAAARRYRYVMEDTVMPVEDYTAEFAIEGRDGGSTVRWSARFEVSDENDRETAEAVRRFLRTGLDALQTKV
jgi:mxaD protein